MHEGTDLRRVFIQTIRRDIEDDIRRVGSRKLCVEWYSVRWFVSSGGRGGKD